MFVVSAVTCPVAEQSALMPQGLCKQGFRLHWTNGSGEESISVKYLLYISIISTVITSTMCSSYLLRSWLCTGTRPVPPWRSSQR